ncbi:TMF_TATA_bd domain-containing protein [Caenorhabditis elegans]|uniref:TMF_TATA_bd domain-containing protein n=1 Tax=Caenorhabditis elegans TaxID=6239 RepID=O17119_CAEEL|nr:TMF_TATA_bd domain-containing protein [Caenorhabditis elegans]CCD69706.2 TMF_TATA_bd domain-containing protein [Caenorhabditis elegans]|eukprot:NP_001343659.1 Uncharacterized protein CELE_M151.2 [Caenorhabditis elegans]
MSSNNPNEVQDDQEEARIPVPVGSQHSPVNAELPSLASGEFWHSGTRGNLRQASSAECQRLLQRTDEAAKQSAAAQEEQIEKLAEQGRKKDDKLKELENNAEALKTQLQEQTNDAKKAKDELQKSLKSAAARATEATTAVAELQAKLQTVEKEHKKEIEDAKEALAAEKQNSEREKMELKKLTEELQRMNLENKELKNRVASENSRATGAVQEAQVLQEKLQQALKALDEKTTKLTTQENAHKLRMDQFEDDTKKRHKKEIKALEVEVKKRNATIKEHQVAAQERRAKHDAEVEELEQKLATEEEKCRRIVQDIREKLDAQLPMGLPPFVPMDIPDHASTAPLVSSLLNAPGSLYGLEGMLQGPPPLSQDQLNSILLGAFTRHLSDPAMIPPLELDPMICQAPSITESVSKHIMRTRSLTQDSVKVKLEHVEDEIIDVGVNDYQPPQTSVEPEQQGSPSDSDSKKLPESPQNSAPPPLELEQPEPARALLKSAPKSYEQLAAENSAMKLELAFLKSKLEQKDDKILVDKFAQKSKIAAQPHSPQASTRTPQRAPHPSLTGSWTMCCSFQRLLLSMGLPRKIT